MLRGTQRAVGNRGRVWTPYGMRPSPSHPTPNNAHLEAVWERLKALKEAQEATEGELKRLEQAILDKAFRGEL